MTTSKTKRRRRTSTAAKIIQGPPPDADLSHIVKPLRPFAVHVASLIMDPRNPQLHDARNLKAIADSLRRFGQDQPLIYRRKDGVIIKGNGRYMAARTKLRWEWIAAIAMDDPVVEAAARGVADNQASRLSDVDDTLMGIVLQTIKESDEELAALVGYTERETDALIASTLPDQLIKQPKSRRGRRPSKPGDLWLLGDHRLLCGEKDPAYCDVIVARYERFTGRKAKRKRPRG